MGKPQGTTCARRHAPRETAWATGRLAGALLPVLILTVAIPIGADEPEGPEQAVIAPLASQALTLDAAVAGNRIVAVGERGHILVSRDGGTSWEQVPVPTRSTLTGVCFADADHGWAVGHDSVILRTTDGGASWERVHWAPEDEAPFFDVWFADAQHGVAVGAYGSYATTSDGGETWAFEEIDPDGWHLHRMIESPGGRLFIAGEAGMVYRSDDNGSSWQALPSPYEGSFFGVLGLEDDVVLLFGLRGHLFRSEDAGESWTAIETGTLAMLTDAVQLEDGTLVICGLRGVLLASEDGGRTFERRQSGSRLGFAAILEVSPDRVLLVGEQGVKTVEVDDLSIVTD